MQKRYLRQVKSGTIYHWTPTLAKRKDMVEIDLKTAQIRIESQKASLAARLAARPIKAESEKQELSELSAVSKQIAELETVEEEIDKAEKAKLKADISAMSQQINPDDIIKTDRPLSEEETKELERANRLSSDNEYQSILAMNAIEELADYLKANYGIVPPKKATVAILKNMSLEQRERRIFEA
jgi:hypothetical protein